MVYRALATHEKVLNSTTETTDGHGRKVLLPAHDLSWVIVSTRDSSSRIHVDAEGLATASLMLNKEGMKYWFVARPMAPSEGVRGSKTDVFAKFDDEVVDPDMRYEGVLLTQGTCL